MSLLLAEQPGLQQVLQECSQRWGKARFKAELLENVDFCDELLLSLEHQPLPREVRQEAYASLIGPGPGGLRAFAWMLQEGLLDSDTAVSYLECLQPGSPRPGAMDAGDALPMVEQLRSLLGSSSWAPRLLASNALSLKARQSLFHELFSPELMHWALSTDAPRELQREALQRSIVGGRSPAHLLEELLEPPSPLALDLVERHPEELPPHLRQRALLHFKDSSNSAARRRAFQLLEKHDGPDWVHQGLRDSDANVRSWAMQRRRQSGEPWKNSN